jgi:hypothetical protein
MKYAIEEGLVNAVLGFLAQQPYQQVFKMVNALQTLKPVDEKQPVAVEQPKV